jgi:hypothetical protein
LAALSARALSASGELIQELAIHPSGDGELLSVALSDGAGPTAA